MRTTLSVHEEMVQYGVESQSIGQLLAIIIGNEKKAGEMAKDKNIIYDISRNNYDGLLNNGLSKKEAQRLAAAVQLGKRIAENECDREHVTSPHTAVQLVMPKLRYETHERFIAILLNTKNRVIKEVQISEGSLTGSIVHPREVFAPAVTNHAASILVAHNHPSGDPYPSSDDKNLTRHLKDAGEVLGIPVLDHIIIADGRYYSFKEHGEM